MNVTGKLFEGDKFDNTPGRRYIKCRFNEVFFDLLRTLSVEFEDCKFDYCSFTNCVFCYDSFTRCTFHSVDFNDCSFYAHAFNACKFRGIVEIDGRATDDLDQVFHNTGVKGVDLQGLTPMNHDIMAFSRSATTHSAYVLFRIGNRYIAGCRNFNRREALKHWTTISPRPSFVEAIRNDA